MLLNRSLLPILVVALLWLVDGPSAEGREDAPDGRPVEGGEGTAGGSDWLVVGTFKGSTHGGLRGTLSNFLFEYENDESLFRDFGDLGIGIGTDIGSVGAKVDVNFRRRVVSNHEDLPPGAAVTSEDLSIYRNVNSSRTRLRLDYEYIPEVFTDEDGVSIQVEGGYSVSVSRAHRGGSGPEEPLDDLIEDPSEEPEPEEGEMDDADPGVVYVTAQSAASVVGSISGLVGNKLADTERAAIYWDDYAAPIMLFPKTGLPLKMKVFLRDDPTLGIGDRLTFTSFVAVSPIVAGIKQYGARIGLRYYWRFLRETTVEKNEDGFLTVRVRNWRGRGLEITPFKFRPEVEIWFFTVGYTFFETVRDRFKETTSEAVYRVDLKTEGGLERFRRLIRQSGRITVSPRKPEAFEEEGVETLASEISRGKNQNSRLRASFFNWFRYRRTRIGTTRRIHSRRAVLNEAVRVSSKDYRKTLGRNRDVRGRIAVMAQADVERLDLPADPDRDESGELSILFSGSYTNRYATGRDAGSLVRSVQALLDLERPPLALEELDRLGEAELGRLTTYVDTSMGLAALRRMEAATEEEIWTALAQILLGPDHGEAWSTPEKRHWWEPGASGRAAEDPAKRDPGRHYDALRGFTGRPARRSRIFDPTEYRSTDLYRIAMKTRKKIRKLDVLFREDPDCLNCLVRAYSSDLHTILVQAVLIRLAGGIDSGAVGYEYSILAGDMVRPVTGTNHVFYGFQRTTAGNLLPTAEQTWESPPRLRAGQFLLNVSGAEAKIEETEPCGKIRLFADHVFAEDLSLRIVYRRNRGIKVDETLVIDLAGMGEPEELTDEILRSGAIDYSGVSSERGLTSEFASFDDRTMASQHGVSPFTGRFEQAKYFYEILVPRFVDKPAKSGYTILLRVVNEAGDPVTEEQEILVQPAQSAWDSVPATCWEEVGLVELAETGSGS